MVPDELGIGEFSAAIKLVLVLANKFKDTVEITNLLEEVISQSATNAFADELLRSASNRERNRIFEQWENVDIPRLQLTLAQRLKSQYYRGGDNSIYSRGSWRDWQVLVSWLRAGDTSRDDVQAYLEDEFDRRPKSIGKHILWLRHSLGTPEGKKIVNDLFPVSRLAELAKRHGSSSYSTEDEQKAVASLIKEFGNSGNGPITPLENT